MLIGLLQLAFAAEPGLADHVAALFPGAGVTEVQGTRAIAPVTRKGEVGWIRVDTLSSVPVSGGRTLVSFQLDTTKGIEATPAALEGALDPEAGAGTWTRVLQVALLGPDGRFVMKPEGFPLEQVVDVRCMGDFCELGPRGKLHPVKGAEQYAVLELEANPESMGSIVPLSVRGDTVKAHAPVAHGSSGGLSGCESVQEIGGFREHEGRLKAGRMRFCRGSEEDCAASCPDGFTTERTLSPITLVEAP